MFQIHFMNNDYGQAWRPEFYLQNHVIEGENQILKIVLGTPRSHYGTHVLPHPRIQTK